MSAAGDGVQSEVAALVIVRANIVSVGDGLFRNVPGQTFKFTAK